MFSIKIATQKFHVPKLGSIKYRISSWYYYCLKYVKYVNWDLLVSVRVPLAGLYEKCLSLNHANIQVLYHYFRENVYTIISDISASTTVSPTAAPPKTV